MQHVVEFLFVCHREHQHALSLTKTCYQHIVVFGKNSVDPQSGIGMARVFLALPTIWLETCLSATVCHLGCSAWPTLHAVEQPDPWHRAVASSSHCQPMGSKEISSQSELEPKASPPQPPQKTIKHDLKPGPSKTITQNPS